MARTKYYQALTRAMREEMRRDPTVMLMGIDVGSSGGIFAQTRGLFQELGPGRVRDTPISENGFVSAAVGAAMTGLRPIVEIGFEDFLTCCVEPLVNQAAKLRYMLGGQVSVPLFLYTFGGGGVNAGPQHSQCLAAWFAHVPGLKVVTPATPADVLGMAKAGIRDNNPVLCLLSKKLIGSTGEVPADGEDFVLPLGVAEIKRPGRDLTIVANGQMLPQAMAAAQQLATERGVEAEVVDPRTISPLDTSTIVESVRRTGRLLIVHEGYGPFGVGAEVLASVMEQAHGALKAAPVRLTGPFAPSPFTPSLEKLYIPDARRIAEAAVQLVERA